MYGTGRCAIRSRTFLGPFKTLLTRAYIISSTLSPSTIDYRRNPRHRNPQLKNKTKASPRQFLIYSNHNLNSSSNSLKSGLPHTHPTSRSQNNSLYYYNISTVIMSMNSLISANSAAGNEGIAGFTTFGNWVGGATGGQHTPVPTDPPIFIHLVGQQGKKRRRSESNDDGYESDSESEAPAKRTRPTYPLERYLSEPFPSPAQRIQTNLVVIGDVDRLVGEETGSPGSSKTSSSASNSMCGPCASTSTGTRSMSRSRSRSMSGSTSGSASGSMSGSTGTAGTGILSDDKPPTHGLISVPYDPSFRMNRYLSESRKESPIPLIEMEWEGQATRESDPPASDSLETDLLPWNKFLASPTLKGMLFLVHLFLFSFHSSTQAVGKWDYRTLCLSFDIEQYCAFYILQALMR